MPLGINAAYTKFAIVWVLVFTGFPFVVRTVQPVLEEIEPEVEEAAAILGASRLQVFLRILLPTVFPAILSGFAQAFARGLGVGGRKREMVGITVRGKRVGSWGKKKKEKESKRKSNRKRKVKKVRSCNREQIFGVVLVEYKRLALQQH